MYIFQSTVFFNLQIKQFLMHVINYILCWTVRYEYDNDYECIKCNWDTKINAVDNVLKQANISDLTLLGKISIVKSHAILKLIYSASCHLHMNT